MPLVEITVTATEDGQPLPGFPYVVRMNPAESVRDKVTHTGNDGTSYVALSKLATENGFMLFTDTQLTIRLNGQTEAGVLLNAGGMILMVNGQLTAGVNGNVTLNNVTGNIATLNFWEFGP